LNPVQPVLAPEPEVEDDVGAQFRGPHAELNQLALDEVMFVWWVLTAEQRDLPLVNLTRAASGANARTCRTVRGTLDHAAGRVVGSCPTAAGDGELDPVCSRPLSCRFLKPLLVLSRLPAGA
jgi:hypothetical protein